MKINVGFNEAEEFGLGLKLSFRSKKYRENVDVTRDAVRAAMRIKLGDEKRYKSELFMARNKARKKIEEEYGKNTKTTRRILRELRDEAQQERNLARDKYTKKISHLKSRHKEEKEEKDDEIPAEMGEYTDLSIFNRYKFEEIEEWVFEVRIVGDVSLTKQEAQVLKLHPKLFII